MNTTRVFWQLLHTVSEQTTISLHQKSRQQTPGVFAMGSSRPAQTVGSVPLQNAFVNLLDFNFFKAREIRNNIFQILITAKKQTSNEVCPRRLPSRIIVGPTRFGSRMHTTVRFGFPDYDAVPLYSHTILDQGGVSFVAA